MYLVYQDRSSANKYNYLEPWKDWQMIKCFPCIQEATAFCQTQNLQLIRQFDHMLDENLLNHIEFNLFLQSCYQFVISSSPSSFMLSEQGHQHQHHQQVVRHIVEQLGHYFHMSQIDEKTVLDILWRPTTTTTNANTNTTLGASNNVIEVEKETFVQFRSRVIDSMLDLKRMDHPLLLENEGFGIVKLEFSNTRKHLLHTSSNSNNNNNLHHGSHHHQQTMVGPIMEAQPSYHIITTTMTRTRKRSRSNITDVHRSTDHTTPDEPMQKRIRRAIYVE